jgi:hypothetical protein
MTVDQERKATNNTHPTGGTALHREGEARNKGCRLKVKRLIVLHMQPTHCDKTIAV